MEFASILGIASILVAIAVLEWRQLRADQRKERFAMIALCIAGGILAVLLVYNREMAGPTQLIDAMYKPLADAFEQWSEERSLQP